MSLASLSRRLLGRLRRRDAASDRSRAAPRLRVRALERRVVLDATVGLGVGTVSLEAFDAGSTVTLSRDLFDIDGDTVADDVYRFSLDAGTWTDGFVNLAGGIDLDGAAGAEGFVDGSDLYVSAAFLETNAGGLTVAGDGSQPTIVLADDVTTAGQQVYGSHVELAGDVVLGAGAGNVMFVGTVTGPHAVTIESSGLTTFQGTVDVGSLTTDAGGQTSFTAGVGAVTTSGGQSYGDLVVLGSDLLMTGSVVEFQDDLNGLNHSLEIAGDAIIGDDAGDTVFGLTSLNVTGGTTIHSGSLVTLTTQTYGGGVALGSDVTLTATMVSFEGGVDGGGHSLTVDGDAVIGDASGDEVTGLSFLTVTGDATIGAGLVSTTGVQTYLGDVGIVNDLELEGSLIDFRGDVEGGGSDLTITGDALLGEDGLDAIGGFDSLVIDGDATVRGAFGPATSRIEILGMLTLTADLALDAPQLMLAGDVVGAGHALTLSGTSVLGDDAGDAWSGLASLTVTGAGTTLGAGSIQTAGVQTYQSDVALTSSVALTASGVEFAGSVAGGGHSLAIAGNATLGDSAADSLSGLASLAVSGTTSIAAGSISSTGDQAYSGDVTLGSDVILTASTVAFGGQVIGGGHSLTIEGNAVFGDDSADHVTGVSALSVTGTTAIHTAVITTSGPQSYERAVLVAAGSGLVTLTAASGGVVFGSSTTLAADLTVAAAHENVTFGGAVDGVQHLIVGSTGVTRFDGPVGSATPLASVTTNAGGTTQINGGGVQTTGDQLYGDDVQLGPGTQTLRGDVIHFHGRVDGLLDRQGGLAITSAEHVLFDRAIGSVRDPASVVVRSEDITFADGTWIEVGDAAAGSVHLVATGTLVLPVGFVVRAAFNGGVYDGVANTFLPRPAAGVPETALVELPVDRPVFAGQQNLDQTTTGTIELVVGNAGERGLRVFVDWGDTVAPGDRFEGPGGWADGDGSGGNDVPGGLFGIEGEALVELTHTYSAADVQNQLAIDNTFDVKYAVFQHEAIVIEAARVEQGGESLGTAGGDLNVLTTTMLFTGPGGPRFEPPDPATIPDLVSGTAAIQIAPPSGSAPFEFPVDRPEVVLPANNESPPLEPLVTFQQVTADESASSSPVVGRQQRFVLRLLSPDPTAPPLAEVDLPADSFQADRLQRLFEELPDGAYEIDLLLGENTERPILRFDIRQGRPVVPQESLDGGQLRLEEIQEALEEHSSSVEEGELPPEEGQDVDEAAGLGAGDGPSLGVAGGACPTEVGAAGDEAGGPSLGAAGGACPTVSGLLEWQMRRRAADQDGELLLARRLGRRVSG